MFRVKVPATTANIGPGFDTLGIALDLYNTFEIQRADQLEIKGFPVPKEENLVYQIINDLLNKHHSQCTYALTMVECNVPVSRGLGSSATAIVAGIYLANYLMDFPFSEADILTLANTYEGHPDNTSPCILGNMVLSVETKDKGLIPMEVPWPDGLIFKAFIPNFKQSTEQSRQQLPLQYTIDDIKFNLSRLPLLIHGIEHAKYEVLKVALEDKLHQPYRWSSIKDADHIRSLLEASPCLGYFISGSGPTIIGLFHSHHNEALNEKYMTHLNQQWQIVDLNIAKQGTITEVLS